MPVMEEENSISGEDMSNSGEDSSYSGSPPNVPDSGKMVSQGNPIEAPEKNKIESEISSMNPAPSSQKKKA